MCDAQCHVTYRPIRIGWVIEPGDLAGLRRAMQLSYTLWGGVYHPMLWADSSLVENARRLRVDVLATPEGDSYAPKEWSTRLGELALQTQRTYFERQDNRAD